MDTGAAEEGTVEDAGVVEDTGTAEEDENPKPASRSVGVDAAEASLQDDEAGAQPKHQISGIDPDATQKARDSLFALDSILGFVERRNDRPPNRSPSLNGERRQTRVTLPSTSMTQSAGSSSGLADVHSTELSPPLRNALNDCQRPPELIRLQPSPQEPSTPGIPSLEQYQPNPNTLPVTLETDKHLGESSAPRRIDKPPQNIHAAEGDRCSSKFGISRTSIGAQTSQPASVHNLPPHHIGVRCLGTVRNDEGRTVSSSSDSAPFRSHTQGPDPPDVPQSPRQTSIQNIGVGKPSTSSLNSRHDQPAQQLSKSRSDDTSKACQGQGVALVDTNRPRQSSADNTGTNNSFSPATGLVPEQNPHTPLPVSNFPQPASPHSSATSNVAGNSDPQIRHLHALPLQSSSPPPPDPSQLSPSTYSPSLIFAIDNRTKSALSSADAQQLIQTFIISAAVLLRPDQTSTREENYPASIIMWRTLVGFYEWYITETRTAEISVLKFSLLDVPWQLEKDFLLYEGDKPCFGSLKQYIWDCFWAASNMNGGPARFRILITPALRLANEVTSHSSHAPGWSDVDATASALLVRPRLASNFENIRVAAYQQPSATPVTRRHCGLPPLYHPSVRPDNNDATTPQTQSASAQVNRSCTDQRPQYPESIKGLPVPPYHNGMWMSVVTGSFETSRTANDKKRLRNRAAELVR